MALMLGQECTQETLMRSVVIDMIRHVAGAWPSIVGLYIHWRAVVGLLPRQEGRHAVTV